MPTPQGFWRNDRMIDASALSRFGPTLRLLTVDHGQAVLTSFLAGFPVRTSALPEKATGSTGCGPVSGHSSLASSARFDPITSSLRTHQLSLLEAGCESLPTLPAWGTIVAGELYPQPTPSGLVELRSLITSESGSGLPARAPTPTAGDAKSSGSRNLEASKAHAGVSLTDYVQHGNSTTPRRVPTPNCPNGGRSVKHVTDWRGASAYHNGKKVQVGLEAAVQGLPKRVPTPRCEDSQCAGGHLESNDTLYGLVCRPKRVATPTVQDSSNNGAPSQKERNSLPLNAEVGGALNPTWVEWLMGWPLGWTDLNAPATDKFQQWLDSHGAYSHE